MLMSAAESIIKVTIFVLSSLPLTKYFVPLLSDATFTVGTTGSEAGVDAEANAWRRSSIEEGGRLGDSEFATGRPSRGSGQSEDENNEGLYTG